MKGAELSPRSQALFRLDLYSQAGLPAGVLNYLIMSRENAPAPTSQIIAHPAIRAVAVRQIRSPLRTLLSVFTVHWQPQCRKANRKGSSSAPEAMRNGARREGSRHCKRDYSLTSSHQ